MDKQFAIFDMDGTLVDSMGYWQSLEREFLLRKGVTEGLDEILEMTKPMTLPEAAALYAQYCDLQETPEQMEQAILSIMEEHYRTDVAIKPGAKAYLDALQARGVRMCVASATPAHLVRLCLERLELAPYFEFLLSCADVGAGKNRPDVFLEAAHRLGCAPHEAAVFEDSVYAVRSAHSAGFYVAAVHDGPRNESFWGEMTALADEAIVDWNNA